MKISGKNSYEEIESALLQMMNQTVVIRLPSFVNKGENYKRSTRAGVMESFSIKEITETKRLNIMISFSNNDKANPFALDDFEIELLPAANSLDF